MNKSAYIFISTGSIILSILASCAPASRLTFVKAKPVNESVTMNKVKHQESINVLLCKEALVLNTTTECKNIPSKTNTLSVVKYNKAIHVAHTNMSNKLAHAINRGAAKFKPIGIASSNTDPELKKAVGLMILGLIIVIFSLLPLIGWIFAIIGSVIFLIGVYFLIMFFI